MIFGKLDDFEAMGLESLGGAVWRSIEWIRKLPANASEGRYRLGQSRIHALVMRCATVDPARAQFESHRRFVDLHYTMDGGEVIEWAPRDSLEDSGPYHSRRDVQIHQPGSVRGRVVMTAGYFALITPIEAHRPKVRAAGFGHVAKLVLKIPVGVLRIS